MIVAERALNMRSNHMLDDARTIPARSPKIDGYVAKPSVQSTRSNRVMSHMDGDTKIVHARLEAWANFVREPVNGWPRRTQLGKLIDGEIVRSVDRQPVCMPDEVAITDRAVAHLREIDRRVIETYYLRWEPPEVMCRRLSMRVNQFQNVLKRARWRIGGYLAAISGDLRRT